MSDLPGWLRPIADGARAITADELTRFVPPPDSDARRGAVLMLFGEGPAGPDLLLTERAHDMRSHPGQVSFPGGSLDPTDASPAAAALREAEEETGLDPAGVEVFAELPELWLPPSNFAVTPVLGLVARGVTGRRGRPGRGGVGPPGADRGAARRRRTGSRSPTPAATAAPGS